MNITVLRGIVTDEPRFTSLPDGSIVHNFEVRTGVEAPRHTVPVALHDPSRPPRFSRGDEIMVVGLVRKRWFRVGASSRSRTEVLATFAGRPDTVGAERAVARAIDDLR